MARKKIREYTAKKIIAGSIPHITFQSTLIDLNTNLESLPLQLNQQFTIKPDQLFGKRKKHNLVLLNANINQVKDYLKEHLNKEITIGKATDKLTHFIIEPYIPHEKEYYFSITSERDGDLIQFSEEGGINVEENWDKMKQQLVPVLDEPTVNVSTNTLINKFITNLLKTFRENNFISLELNPFTIKDDQIYLLDAVAEVDSCSSNLELPQPFGKKISEEEQYINKLDQHSGASLKLTILNPNGKIWNILSGGGASIILLDQMVQHGEEIANYGEYSGNPTTEESYQYAKTILDLMTKSTAENKVLIIAGAIANFTDVKKTFQGVAKALIEFKDQLKNIPIHIRRGGPNYEAGLKLMEEIKQKTNLNMSIYGPDTYLTEVIPK